MVSLHGHYLYVPQEGFEPPTHGLGSHCSIQLSYWGIKAIIKFKLIIFTARIQSKSGQNYLFCFFRIADKYFKSSRSLARPAAFFIRIKSLREAKYTFVLPNSDSIFPRHTVSKSIPFTNG